jgi:hypothetical protein
MQTNRRFTAAENKLAYAQSFSRLTAAHHPARLRGRAHLIGHSAGVLQSFVRYPAFIRHSPFVPRRHSTRRHRSGI